MGEAGVIVERSAGWRGLSAQRRVAPRPAAPVLTLHATPADQTLARPAEPPTEREKTIRLAIVAAAAVCVVAILIPVASILSKRFPRADG
jgi:hypothetical protein